MLFFFLLLMKYFTERLVNNIWVSHLHATYVKHIRHCTFSGAYSPTTSTMVLFSAAKESFAFSSFKKSQFVCIRKFLIFLMKLSFIFLILNLSFFFFCDLFKMQHDEQVIRVIKFVLIQSYYYVFVSMFYFLHDLFIFFQHLFSTCSGNFAYVSNYIWFGHICSCKINKK